MGIITKHGGEYIARVVDSSAPPPVRYLVITGKRVVPGASRKIA